MRLLVIITSIVNAIAAGSASVVATVLIETMGGSFGAVIASSPSTIVVFGVATAVTSTSQVDLATTLYMSAVGLFGDALFLWLWRTLPPTQFICVVGGKFAQAALMTATSLGFWMAFAIATIFAIEPLLAHGVPSGAIEAFFWGLNVLLGLYTVIFCYIPPLTGTHKAFCLSHGHALPQSAVGPLILGSVSSPVFAAVLAELLPIMQRMTLQGGLLCSRSSAGGIAVSALIAETAAIVGISLPVYRVVVGASASMMMRLMLNQTAVTWSPCDRTGDDSRKINYADGSCQVGCDVGMPEFTS